MGPAVPNAAARLVLPLLALVPVGFLGLFFAWPVVSIVGIGLGGSGVTDVLTSADTWRLVAFTLGQAAAAPRPC